MGGFQQELEALLNRYSKESGSDTPDFMLAEYLADCLAAFDKAVTARTKWYRPPEPGQDAPTELSVESTRDATEGE